MAGESRCLQQHVLSLPPLDPVVEYALEDLLVPALGGSRPKRC